MIPVDFKTAEEVGVMHNQAAMVGSKRRHPHVDNPLKMLKVIPIQRTLWLKAYFAQHACNALCFWVKGEQYYCITLVYNIVITDWIPCGVKVRCL